MLLRRTLLDFKNHLFRFNYIQTHSYANMNSDDFVLIHKFLYIEFIFLFTVFSLIICLISLFTYTFMNQFTWFHYNAMQWNTMQCNEMKYNEMKWNTAKWNAMKYSEMQWNAMKCNAIYLKCKVLFQKTKPIDYVFNQIYDKTNGLSLENANESTVKRIWFVNKNQH